MRNYFSSSVQPLGQFVDSGGLDGFVQARRKANALHQRRVYEASLLWREVIAGETDPFILREAFNPQSPIAWAHLTRRYPHAFNEAMSTSDFTALTVDVLDRMLLQNYRETPMHWTAVAKKSTLRDFRTVKRFVVNGGESEWDRVDEHGPFKQKVITQPAPYTYEPDVYAGGGKITWRSIINDDLGIFQDLPARLARGGRRTIEKFVTRLYCGSTGFNTSFFTSGNGNIVTSNPVLSVPALATALKVFFKQTDYDGEPIEVDGMNLIVGPALYTTAMNIMNQVTIDMTEAGGTSNQRVRVNNWIIQNMKVVKNPQIPLIASSSNGDTTWFLAADPSTASRPAMEVGFVSGFDSPQLFQKAGNTARVGGAVDQSLGDWVTMATEMKGLLVFGGTTIDPKMMVASNGSGS